jgi:GNAT superfamily N-acetyltransferase
MTVRRLTVADTPALHDLRLRVLRPGRPPEAAVFPGDEDPTTVHLGAFDETGRCLGIATLVRNNGLQLRGMAVEPAARGTGIGAAVLDAVHRIAAEEGFSELWCNARVSAAGFYEKGGWTREGEPFEIPDVGPHYVMRRHLAAPTGP